MALAFAPRAAAAGPAFCPADHVAETIWLDDFESPEFGWQARLLTAGYRPGGSGQLAGSHWHFPPPQAGRQPWSGALNVWADILPDGLAPPEMSQSALAMRDGVALPAGAQLVFVHRFDFTALPGSMGVVEFSLDGGRSWQAYGTFLDSVPGMRSTHLDLSAFAGEALQLRFRVVTVAGADEPPQAGAFRGWAIDDVHIYRCVRQEQGQQPPPATTAPPPAKLGAPQSRQARGAALGLAVAPRPMRLKRGVKNRLRLFVWNRSGRGMRAVRICFRAPLRIVVGRRCTVIRHLPAGAMAELAFTVRLRPAVMLRRPRLAIRFVARGAKGAHATALRRYRLATA